MKKLATLSAILGFSYLPISSATHAAESSYRAEITATYSQLNIDDFDSDITTYDLNGTYYFSEVDTTGHPLAEAAFLEKSSNLHAGWGRTENDFWDARTDITNVGIDFYVPNSILYLGAGLTKIDINDGFAPDDETYWTAKLGITPVDGLLVWSQFYEDVDLSEHWNINAKYVVPLAGDTAINLEAGYADWDDEDGSTRVAADYYFTSSFSLGAGYTMADENDVYEIRARHFFTDKFSMQAAYTSDDYSDGWLVGASLRF